MRRTVSLKLTIAEAVALIALVKAVDAHGDRAMANYEHYSADRLLTAHGLENSDSKRAAKMEAEGRAAFHGTLTKLREASNDGWKLACGCDPKTGRKVRRGA